MNGAAQKLSVFEVSVLSVRGREVVATVDVHAGEGDRCYAVRVRFEAQIDGVLRVESPCCVHEARVERVLDESCEEVVATADELARVVFWCEHGGDVADALQHEWEVANAA